MLSHNVHLFHVFFLVEFQNNLTFSALIAFELQRFTSEGSCLSSRDVTTRPSETGLLLNLLCVL